MYQQAWVLTNTLLSNSPAHRLWVHVAVLQVGHTTAATLHIICPATPSALPQTIPHQQLAHQGLASVLPCFLPLLPPLLLATALKLSMIAATHQGLHHAALANNRHTATCKPAVTYIEHHHVGENLSRSKKPSTCVQQAQHAGLRYGSLIQYANAVNLQLSTL
jgi:hypothetical protein